MLRNSAKNMSVWAPATTYQSGVPNACSELIEVCCSRARTNDSSALARNSSSLSSASSSMLLVLDWLTPSMNLSSSLLTPKDGGKRAHFSNKSFYATSCMHLQTHLNFWKIPVYLYSY